MSAVAVAHMGDLLAELHSGTGAAGWPTGPPAHAMAPPHGPGRGAGATSSLDAPGRGSEVGVAHILHGAQQVVGAEACCSPFHWLLLAVGWLVGWLVGFLSGGVGWLVGWPLVCLSVWLVG